MARVTIEDCSKIIPSRFELVVLAAQRAKEISAGAKLTVERDNDKNAVVALREISMRNVDPDALRECVIKRYQKVQSNELIDAPDDGMSEESEIAQEIKSYSSSTEEMPDDGFYDDAELEEKE